MNNMNEHKKGVKAKIYNKKPVPLVGPEALKKKEQQKKSAASTEKKLPEAFKMPPMSAQEKLYKKHQEIRKKRGAPDPEYYKKLGQQKQKEIDDMKKSDVSEAEMGKIVDYKPGQTATLASGPGMTTIIDLKKNPTSLTKDPSTGKLTLMGPQATGTPAATATQPSTIKAGDAVEISKEDDVSRMKNLAGISEAPAATTAAAPKIQVPPIPKLPAQDGDQGDGSVVKTNPDGTKTYAGAFGTFTYDKTGKAIKYGTPSMSGMSQTIDLTNQQTTQNYSAGPLNVNQTTDASGKQTSGSAEYDMGTTTATKTFKQENLDSILHLAGMK
jgi:hypothetical protein